MNGLQHRMGQRRCNAECEAPRTAADPDRFEIGHATRIARAQFDDGAVASRSGRKRNVLRYGTRNIRSYRGFLACIDICRGRKHCTEYRTVREDPAVRLRSQESFRFEREPSASRTPLCVGGCPKDTQSSETFRPFPAAVRGYRKGPKTRREQKEQIPDDHFSEVCLRSIPRGKTGRPWFVQRLGSGCGRALLPGAVMTTGHLIASGSVERSASWTTARAGRAGEAPGKGRQPAKRGPSISAFPYYLLPDTNAANCPCQQPEMREGFV